MQAPSTEAAPIIIQKAKMPDNFGNDVTHMKLNNFILTDTKRVLHSPQSEHTPNLHQMANPAGVISSCNGYRPGDRRGSFSNQSLHQVLSQIPSQARSNSAGIQSRNQSQIDSKSSISIADKKRKKRNESKPIAPSSESSERRREITMAHGLAPEFKNNLIVSKAAAALEPRLPVSYNGPNHLENLSSVSSSKIESQLIPLHPPSIPPRNPNSQANKSQVLKNEVMFISNIKPRRSSSASRNSIAKSEMSNLNFFSNDEMGNKDKRRASSRPVSAKEAREKIRKESKPNQKKPNPNVGKKEVPATHKSKPSYTKVESKIKDLIKKDRSNYEKDTNVFSKKYEPEILEAEYLTEAAYTGDDAGECTFRSNQGKRNEINPNRQSKKYQENKELSGGHTLEMSVDESRGSNASATLLNRKEHEHEERIGRGSNNKKTRRSEAMEEEGGDRPGVMSIASNLLNSDILKRFNNSNMKTTERRMPADDDYDRRFVNNQIEEDSVEDERINHGGYKGYDSNEESREAVRLKQQFFQVDRNSFDSEDQDYRKEDFKKEDYELNFNETSRVSSSQFSAFCPNDDMKSFFKKEFTDSRKERQGEKAPVDHNTIGEVSYSSSKLTYGPNSMFIDKKFSGRSHRDEYN